ncbi:MAG TPA: hypothetical protein VFZ09_44575 [Archangium sp.]|uniref:hypothetical protein n=1 Tax=Archangium sp. TaxID=1872627 RepID=UPI002E368F11|nr:hypothetical protein [Archangium sp.]HEX5753359.1 hypothetical protein [Archangium sp.]
MAPVVEPDAEPEAEQPEGGEYRTMFATHAALFAERLKDRFAKKIYGRTPHRVLRIDEPEGPSTAGGKLARQPISLVPRRGTAPTIVCGWVDVARKEAQLRGHESVAKRYEAHHGAPIDIAEEDYERCIDDLSEALTGGGIKVRVVIPEEAPARQTASPAPEAGAQGFPLWMVGAVGATAFLLGLMIGRMTG